MLDKHLFDDGLAEFELVYTVNEVLLRNIIAGAFITEALDCLLSNLFHLHDFFEAKSFILLQYREVYLLDTLLYFFIFIVLDHVSFTV